MFLFGVISTAFKYVFIILKTALTHIDEIQSKIYKNKLEKKTTKLDFVLK